MPRSGKTIEQSERDLRNFYTAGGGVLKLCMPAIGFSLLYSALTRWANECRRSAACFEPSLIFSAALSALPILPHAEGFQLLVEVSITHHLLDIDAVDPGTNLFRQVGELEAESG